MSMDEIADAIVANYLEQTGRHESLQGLMASIAVGSRAPVAELRSNHNLPSMHSILTKAFHGTNSPSNPTEFGLSPEQTNKCETIKLVVWAATDSEPDILSVDCMTLPTVKLSAFELFVDFYGLKNIDNASRLRFWHRYSYEDQRWVVTQLTQPFTVAARTCRILLKQADIDRAHCYGLDLELSIPDVPGVKRPRQPSSEDSMSKRYAAAGAFGTPTSTLNAYSNTAAVNVPQSALVSSYLGASHTASPYNQTTMTGTPIHHSQQQASPVQQVVSSEPLMSGQGKGQGRWPQRHTFASVLPILKSIVEDEASQPRNSKIRQTRLEAANVDALKNKSNAAQAILLLRSYGVEKAEQWGMIGDNGNKSWSEFRKHAVESGAKEKEIDS